MTIQLKTRVDFPFHYEEQFVVRDGDGHGVEFWRHVSGPRKFDTDKAHEQHVFVVRGYRDVRFT